MNFKLNKLFALVFVTLCLIETNVANSERILSVAVPPGLTGYQTAY